MVVKVFCGKEFSRYEHEYKQFKEIYDIINDKYVNTEEPIYILANFDLSNAQIDVLILTEKGTAILELKSYQGKIIGSENGDWKVITEIGKEEKLPKNLFQQLRDQKFAFLEKFNIIRKGNFERIEENKLARIKCWGYFEKGSNYDVKQVGEGVHIWFNVITANDLIEKLNFVNASYLLKAVDMDAIVEGLKLKEYPGFESIGPVPPPKHPEKLESLLKKDKFQWVKHDLLPLFGLLDFSDYKRNGFFTLPLSKENLIYNLERISGKHRTKIEVESFEFEEAFKEYIDLKNGDYIYVSDSGISKGRHPPSRNPCKYPNDSTKYYVLKREIKELSDQELRNIQTAPQEIFIKILSTVQTVEDLLYLVVLKKISEKCKSPNYYHYFGETEPLKEVMEIAKIDEEFINYFLSWDSEFELDFEKMKNFFPADNKLFAVFYSHDFNLSSCHRLSNIRIRSDVAQYFYDTLNKIDIEKNLRENYAKVRQKIIMTDNRLPLFEYKYEELIFIKKYYDKLLNRKKPFYRFEFEGHEGHYATEVKSLKDRNIIDIEGDKIILLSEDKLKALRNGLEEVELERIDRNKKELTIRWLTSGINIQFEPPVRLSPKTPNNGLENNKKSEENNKDVVNGQTEKDNLRIYLGKSEDNNSIYWEPDGTKEKPRMVSGNILITGGAGSGKTETLKSILYELNNMGYICLALGFHPDLTIEGFKYTQITAKSNIGINPLDFDSLDEDGGGLPIQVYNVVERLKNTYPTIGDIQESNLIEILEEAYKRKGISESKETWKKTCPNFEDVERILNDKISQTNDKDLIRLRNKLSKIFKFNIFSKKESIDFNELFQKSTILDLSKLPDDFLFLVSDTILRKMYRNLKLRNPIEYDAKGKERFRIFIAIDEAKILASNKGDTKAIINIFGTEARKFGVGFIVSSQLTSHFGDDVLGNMATKIALKPLKHNIAVDNAKELSIDPDDLMNIKNPGEGFIRFSNEETKKIFLKSYDEKVKDIIE